MSRRKVKSYLNETHAANFRPGVMTSLSPGVIHSLLRLSVLSFSSSFSPVPLGDFWTSLESPPAPAHLDQETHPRTTTSFFLCKKRQRECFHLRLRLPNLTRWGLKISSGLWRVRFLFWGKLSSSVQRKTYSKKGLTHSSGSILNIR